MMVKCTLTKVQGFSRASTFMLRLLWGQQTCYEIRSMRWRIPLLKTVSDYVKQEPRDIYYAYFWEIVAITRDSYNFANNRTK